MKNTSFKMPRLNTILFALLSFVLLTPVIGLEPSAIFSAGTVVASCLPMPAGVLGLNNTNNISALESYVRAQRLFEKAFRDRFSSDAETKDFVSKMKFSQSEIRLEVELTATATQFLFALTPNQQNTTGVTFNTERRLTLQDSFCANEYGIFIGQPSSRIDTTWAVRSYPNTQDFAAADVTALNSTFYSHGWFEMRCNNDVVMPYRGLFNHLYRPQTQQTAALGANSPQDQIRGAEDGFITDEPNIILIGSKGYQPQINLPVNLASAANFLRCVLIFRGVLAQNSTPVS